ncbi:MAG: sulfotransferase [Actinomycetota bacterium]|nr:sulfotransferase [Actinomycetota bacterium]
MEGHAWPVPPFFIVGSARSGTTLLRLMLNAHPEVAIPPESRFISEMWRGKPEVEVEPVLDALARHDRFRLWELPIEEVRADLDGRGSGRVAPYTEVMEAPYRAWARRRDKPLWGDKTPRYVESIPLLAGLWAPARFVHLVRDGRNVALSYADVAFGPKIVAKAARLWARRVRAGIEAGRGLEPGRYLQMRYEDLVEDTERHARTLCGFLGLSFDPVVLDYVERGRDAVLPRAAANNPNVTRPLMTQTRSWEQAMPEGQVEVFEAVAGQVLSELGYPRRYPEPSGAATRRARLGRLGIPVDRLPSSRAR